MSKVKKIIIAALLCCISDCCDDSNPYVINCGPQERKYPNF